MSKRAQFILKLMVSVLIFAALIGFVDWRNVLLDLRNADWEWALAAIGFVSAAVALSAVRWQRLVALVATGLTLGKAIRAYWIGFLSSNLLPASIAGDVVRAAIARKHGGAVRMAAIILLERLSGLFVLLLLAAIAIWHLPEAVLLPIANSLASGLFLAMALGIPIVCWLAHSWLAKRQGPTVGGRILQQLAQTIGALQSLPKLRYELLATFGLSVIFYVLLVGSQFAQLQAVGASVGLGAVFVAVPLIALISALPISFNGLGVAEGLFVLIYTQFGIDADVALAAAILRRLTIMIVASLGVVFLLRSSNE